MTIINLDEEYIFEIDETLKPEYHITPMILDWLKKNLEDLVDDNNKKIFSKVNIGYTENNLKSFGNRPVADIHINNIEYDDTLEEHHPIAVNTVLILFIKGSREDAYFKLAELHDLILQEFLTNDEFKFLQDIVIDTYITDSKLSNQPRGKVWNCVAGFEFKHMICY